MWPTATFKMTKESEIDGANSVGLQKQLTLQVHDSGAVIVKYGWQFMVSLREGFELFIDNCWSRQTLKFFVFQIQTF